MVRERLVAGILRKTDFLHSHRAHERARGHIRSPDHDGSQGLLRECLADRPRSVLVDASHDPRSVSSLPPIHGASAQTAFA